MRGALKHRLVLKIKKMFLTKQAMAHIFINRGFR